VRMASQGHASHEARKRRAGTTASGLVQPDQS
jgi:hypothetical protein